jgi:hypothetical protein
MKRASRQMAFQFSGARLVEMIDKVNALVGDVHREKLDAALAEKFPDEKECRIARASIVTLVKCYDNNIDYRRVRKVIVWRNEKGEPGEVHIEVGKE